MDEQSFDRYVKNKLDEYESPGYDASAFESLHGRLAHYPQQAWYRSGRRAITYATLAIIFTLINGYMFLQWAPQRVLPSAAPLATRDSLDARMNSLFLEVRQLHSEIDRLHQENLIITEQAKAMQQRLDKDAIVRAEKWHAYAKPGFADTIRLHFYAGENEPQDEPLLDALLRRNIVTAVDGKLYLNTTAGHGRMVSSTIQFPDISTSSSAAQIQKARIPPPVKQETVAERAISASMRNRLEKHYQRGIGIFVAPHADLMAGLLSVGHGIAIPRAGISADWIISPSLSIETSIDYVPLKYKVDPHQLQRYATPGNDYLGALNGVTITTPLISMPVGIRYRRWISYRDQVFIKGSFAPYLAISSRYERRYSLENSGGDKDDKPTISQSEKVELRKYYGGTLSASVGMMRKINKNNNRLELSAFYERSVGKLSVDNSQLQLAGIRSAYWFKVK
jgi:hypothetical protein